MRARRFLMLLAVSAVACSGDDVPTLTGDAAPEVGLRESRPGLLARAVVDEATARAAALARVPGGRVVEAELEEEGGRLLYSYDIEVPGRTGRADVEVDAITGLVLGIEHEDGIEAGDDDGQDEGDGGHDDDDRGHRRG